MKEFDNVRNSFITVDVNRENISDISRLVDKAIGDKLIKLENKAKSGNPSDIVVYNQFVLAIRQDRVKILERTLRVLEDMEILEVAE